MGIASNLIVVISAITLLYSIVALILTIQKDISIPLLRTLIYANWLWVVVSIVLSFFHFEKATAFGQAFLILQIVVVAGLAYFEGVKCLVDLFDSKTFAIVDLQKSSATTYEKDLQIMTYIVKKPH